MKDSCSCGKTVYELNGKKVIVHDLTKWTHKTETFDTLTEAEYYYTLLTFNVDKQMKGRIE